MKCKSVWHTWFAKREKEEVEEEDFFFQWLASERRPRCRYKKYMFLSSIDFGMILVCWFECGMIV